MDKMSVYFRKLRGVICIGMTWGILWGAIFAVLARIVEAYDPNQIDPGEEPIRLAAIIGWVGLVSGGVFGLLLSVAENGKSIRNLSLMHAALWGILSSAVFPLLIQREDQVFWTCPLGAIVAMALIVLARKAELRDSEQPKRLHDLFFGFILTSVRDAINPSTEPATRARATPA